MKVKEIYIKEFRQFKDFTLDLTYPKGHAKEGLPLDKVCFIGQSGTGKTNLLKLLYILRIPGELQEKLNADAGELGDKVAYKVTNFQNDTLIAVLKSANDDNYDVAERIKPVFYINGKYQDVLSDKKIYKDLHDKMEIAEFLEARKNEKLIYFPAGIKYDLKETEENKFRQNKRIFDFSKESIYSLWKLIAVRVTRYQEEILKFRQNISILTEQRKDEASKREVENLEAWKESTVNPLTPIAEKCINPLIKNFSMRVKEDFIIEKKEDIGFIKLENIDGKEIPYNSWSTGTKQVILSALPLYLIEPENSTILFDEPETSLYPDLQRVIIDYYQGLVKDNNQFFYATHSPIIASSFEPWEIVELKFDDAGFVYREKYFEGENHVDNYYIDPRYLNFDLMLKEVFDMKFTNGDKRYEALSEYGMLKNQLETLKQNNELQTEQAKDIYKRFKSLSRKLVNPQ